MGVEAMSAGLAVGATTSIACGPAISSFGGEFSGAITPSVGGSRVSGFDSAAFSETFQMAAPLPSSFAGDKANPDVSPLENTQVMWQAPTEPAKITPIDFDAVLNQIHQASLTPKINLDSDLNQIQKTISVPKSELSIFEIQPDIQPDNLIQEITSNDSIIENISLGPKPLPDEPTLDIDLKANNFIQEMSNNGFVLPEITQQAISTSIIQQDVIADAKQAIKVEDALMAIGTPKDEAHDTALKIFKETQERKEKKSNYLQGEKQNIFFEHDAKADEARRGAAAIAVEELIKEVNAGNKETVGGYDIADHMPNPQPQIVKSEIVENGKDGSYDSLVEQLKTTGEIYSAEEAKNIIEKLINENHAVRITKAPNSNTATEQEVRKVLKSGIIFENKI